MHFEHPGDFALFDGPAQFGDGPVSRLVRWSPGPMIAMKASPATGVPPPTLTLIRPGPIVARLPK
jgi:hypothetical protein